MTSYDLLLILISFFRRVRKQMFWSHITCMTDTEEYVESQYDIFYVRKSDFREVRLIDESRAYQEFNQFLSSSLKRRDMLNINDLRFRRITRRKREDGSCLTFRFFCLETVEKLWRQSRRGKVIIIYDSRDVYQGQKSIEVLQFHFCMWIFFVSGDIHVIYWSIVTTWLGWSFNCTWENHRVIDWRLRCESGSVNLSKIFHSLREDNKNSA